MWQGSLNKMAGRIKIGLFRDFPKLGVIVVKMLMIAIIIVVIATKITEINDYSIYGSI